MDLALLLIQISHVNKKYDEIYKYSGEQFNIFSLLNLTADEISHSSFLATLLNPKGMHGKNKVFLQLFLQCIGIDNFCSNSVIVEKEKFIGFISEDYKSGGRIDISLTNSENHQIFVENKIYANDQWNQLLRYHKYNPKAYLIYLTLYGTEPSEDSTGKNTDFDFIKLSYKEHILKWLELCKKESTDNPILRETLTQYIVLIKKLTGQARSKEMQKEYLDTILLNEDNVSAAFIISQNINEIKLELIKDKFIPLLETLAEKYGYRVDIPLDGCFESYWGFSLLKKEWKIFKIDFEFEGKNFQNLIYGFCGTKISSDLNKYLRGLNYKKSESWPIYQFMDQYRYWNKDFFTDLYSNTQNIVNVFESKIKEIELVIENVEFEL